MRTNREMLIALAWSTLGLAALLSFARLLSGPDAAPFIIGTSMLTVVGAAAIARRVHGFPSVLCWGVAAVGTVYALIVATAEALPVRAGVGSADVIDLVATVAIIAMTARVVHRRRGGLAIGDVFDGLIITGGTWMVSWIVFVEPFVHSGAEPTAALILNAIYLPVTVPLVALAALLVVGAGRPTPAVLLLVTGLLLMVIGDLVHALDATRSLDGWAYTVADISSVFAVGACAAALIHPSAPSLLSVSATPRDRRAPRATDRDRRTPGRARRAPRVRSG